MVEYYPVKLKSGADDMIYFKDAELRRKRFLSASLSPSSQNEEIWNIMGRKCVYCSLLDSQEFTRNYANKGGNYTKEY